MKLTCEQCGKKFKRPGTRGPVPRFCGGTCRQQRFVQRKQKAGFRLKWVKR